MKLCVLKIALQFVFLLVLSTGSVTGANLDHNNTVCLGYELEELYPVGLSSGATVCPSSDSKVIFVSNSDGFDTNNGLSKNAPVQTITKGLTLLRSDMPDWLILKRGDVWTNQDMFFNSEVPRRGGRSALEPKVVTGYGPTNLDRPKLISYGVAIQSFSADYFTFSGLHLETVPGSNSGNGFRILGLLNFNPSIFPSPDNAGPDNVTFLNKDIVIEDNYIRGFGGGISVQGSNDTLYWNVFDPAQYPNIILRYWWMVYKSEAQNKYFILCSYSGITDPNSDSFKACDRDLDGVKCTTDSDNQCDLTYKLRKRTKNLRIINNVIADSASDPAPGGHSSGMYLHSYDNVKIAGNIIDHNGFIDRDCVTPACSPAGSQGATIFNHNAYLSSYGTDLVVEDNMFSQASSHGTQMRSGGVNQRNLYVRNPLGFFLGHGAEKESYRTKSYGRYNVLIEGNDINSSLSRGMAVETIGTWDAELYENIIAHLYPVTTTSNKQALIIGCRTTSDFPRVPERCRTSVFDNIVYDHAKYTNSGNFITASGALWDTVPNQNRVAGNVGVYHNVNGSFTPNPSRITFENNHYVAPSILTRSIFSATAQKLDAWKTTVEPTALGSEPNAVIFTDPYRTVSTYMHEVINARNSPACGFNVNSAKSTYLHDDCLFDAFIVLARAQNRFQQNDQRFKPWTVINYIRAGFDRSQIGPGNNGDLMAPGIPTNLRVKSE